MSKKINKEIGNIQEETVKIDYDLFNTEELVTIFSFFNIMEKNNKHPLKKEIVLDAYNNYRNTINSISLEKKYNKQFEDKTGICIYKVIKALKEKN